MSTVVLTSENPLSEERRMRFEKELRKGFPGDRILFLEGRGLKLQVETSKAK